MDLEYLDSLISSGRFHDALFYLKSVSQNNSLSKEDLVFLFSKKIEIKKILGKEFFDEQKKLLINLYEMKQSLEIAKYFEENESAQFSLTEYEIICHSLIDIGELASAKNIAHRCISELIEEHLYFKLHNFIREISNRGLELDNIAQIECKIAMGLGRTAEFLEIEEGVVLDELELHKRRESLIRRHEVKRIWNKREKSDEKYFSNALQMLLYEPFDKDVLKELVQKFFIMKRKEACEVLTAILLNDKNFNLTQYEQEELIEIQLEIKNFPEFKYGEEVDLGTDLFFSEDLDVASELENKISLLLKMNDKESARQLIEDLKVNEPENPLVEKLEKKYFDVTGTRYIYEPAQNNSGELTRLLEEFQISSSRGFEEDKVFFKKNIEVMSEDELNSIYYDLCVALMMMDFPDLVVFILDLIGQSEKDEENIKRQYLVICAHMQLKNYSKALNEAEGSLEYLPLMETERIDFYYLIAECYRKIGRKIDALKYYARVFQMDQNYRLVKQRINERY